MLTTDREDFIKLLKMLFAGLDKPLGEAREAAFWKALEQMSLTDFSRTCDFVLSELEDGDKRKDWGQRFTPGDVWAAKRRLRSRAPAGQAPSIKKTPWVGDAWDTRANLLLLGYIGDQSRKGISYCSPKDACTASRRDENWAADSETGQMTHILVAYKNAWAQDMRESQLPDGSVPMEIQKSGFYDCMGRADAAIDEIRAEYAHRQMEII
jgi:hypothetical protein